MAVDYGPTELRQMAQHAGHERWESMARSGLALAQFALKRGQWTTARAFMDVADEIIGWIEAAEERAAEVTEAQA